MPTAYKLTDQSMCTSCECRWVLGEWKESSGEGGLCGPGWLHAYNHPLVASFMNPIHACIDNPRLFEVECDGDYLDDHGLKCGHTRMRLVREIELPVLTTEQRVYAGIQCAIASGYADAGWLSWAERWISGGDRSESTAALVAVWSSVRSAAWGAASSSAEAVWSVAWGAESSSALAVARSAARSDVDIINILQRAYDWDPHKGGL
jgi:hypothetical protein